MSRNIKFSKDKIPKIGSVFAINNSEKILDC